jgi:hypothetical protein
MSGASAPTGTEARVCADIAARQALGLRKYGQTVEDNPLPLKAWLQHAYEETLDQAVYLKRAIEQIESEPRAHHPRTTSLKFTDLPALLQPLEGGVFAGLTTAPDGTHHAVVLLADKPDAAWPWKQGMAWAAALGATLPTRPVAALLFANAKDQFEEALHWTSEAFDGSYAWDQCFDDGGQYYDRKSCEGRCRAVRLIQITA